MAVGLRCCRQGILSSLLALDEVGSYAVGRSLKETVGDRRTAEVFGARHRAC